jgi:hypothetical protein
MQTFFTKGQASFHIMIKHALWYAHADIGYAQLSAKKCVEIASKVKKMRCAGGHYHKWVQFTAKDKKTNEKFDQRTHIAHILCMGGGIFDPKNIVHHIRGPLPARPLCCSGCIATIQPGALHSFKSILILYLNWQFASCLYNERLLHSVIAFWHWRNKLPLNKF